jgi:DNA helicase-2/ATP-dependent DNA helicase PcrA
MCAGGRRVSSLHAINSSAIEWFQHVSAEVGDNQNQAEPEAQFALYEEEKDVWLNLSAEIGRSLGDSFTLDAFLQEMQLRSKEPAQREGIVQLLTFHAAKGKEFPHVYVPCMVEDEVPSFQSIKQGANSAELEEERRNCFVAITRTVNTLTLSYASSYNGYRKRPSRFLTEMGLLA